MILLVQEKTFLTWVNEEDQLRIISMQMGGDVRGVFDRLARGIKAVEVIKVKTVLRIRFNLIWIRILLRIRIKNINFFNFFSNVLKVYFSKK